MEGLKRLQCQDFKTLSKLVYNYYNMEKIPNVTTGEILLEEFLEPANISVSAFAEKAGFSLSEALNIISGKIKITPEISDKINQGA